MSTTRQAVFTDLDRSHAGLRMAPSDQGSQHRCCGGMYRKCLRWKNWIVLVIFLVVCIRLLRLSSDQEPRVQSKIGENILNFRPLIPSWEEQIVSKKPSVTVKDPVRFVSVDDVGLRGLQNYDCVRAIEGFPLSSKDFGENSVSRIWDEDFIRLTSNCENFRKRFGYERYGQVSKEELDFPLAFNVLLYKDVDQLHMLLRAIYRPHNVYCLHVDGYANASVYKATAALANCLDNVFLTSKRENITYSGFTRLQADINCMQDHMTWKAEKHGVKTNSKIPWRYLINLPSQQFPLKTNAELVKILTIYNGSNDVEGITAFQVLEERFTLKHVYKWDPKTQRKMIVRTKERLEPPPYNATVVKGSAYGVFSRDFVHFVLHDEHAKALLNWTRHVYSPDEFYWSILHHNPSLGTPGAYHGRPDKKPWLAVYASWPPRDLCVSGKVVRGICIFGVGDLPQIMERKELFANKFYMDFQPITLHCLDQWLYNKTISSLPLNTFYYRKLPFVR